MKALQRTIITKNPAIISILIDLGVPINHDNPTSYDNPMAIAKTFSAEWIVYFSLSLCAEYREVDLYETSDIFLEDCYNLQMLRGGIRLTENVGMGGRILKIGFAMDAMHMLLLHISFFLFLECQLSYISIRSYPASEL